MEEDDTSSYNDDEEHLPDCMYCLDNSSHPFFVYMITTRDSEVNDPDKVNECLAYIGKSKHPFHRICSHNRIPGYRVGAKITKAGAPNWKEELIVGPFYKPGQASEFKVRWRKGYRNVLRRLCGGITEALLFNVELYVRDQATANFLHHYYPIYSDASLNRSASSSSTLNTTNTSHLQTKTPSH